MDDATPEESKPKGIKPAKLTAVIVAAVVVALAGIGGGYAYWTHHESTGYRAAVEQAGKADKALMKAVDEATATTYKADQLKEPKLLDIPVAVGTLLPQRLYDMRLTQFPACGFHFRALLVRCRDHGAGLLTVRTKFLSAGLPHPLHTVQRSGLPHSVWQCRRHKHRGYEQKAEMAFKEFP